MTVNKKPGATKRTGPFALGARKPKSGGATSRPSKPQTSRSSQNSLLKEPGNAFDLLGRHFDWPISLYAVMAAWDIGWSGSEALNLWADGHSSSPDSDLDFYTTSTAGALVDICHVFNFTGIKWNNYIVSKLELLETERTIMIPSAMILSLATLLGAKQHKAKDAVSQKLRSYLDRRMKENGKSSEMVKPFLFHFREKVNKYRQLLSTWGNSSGVFFERANHMKGRVWIYHKGDDLPSEVERRIDGLSEMVDELQFVCSQLNERDLTRSTVRDHLNGCLDDAIGDISLPVTIMTHGLTFEDGEEETVPLPESMPPHYTKLLKREWSRAGLEDDMLREFLTFTLINEMPYENRSKIYMVVREALNLDRDGPKQIYGDDFRIMSGIMPNKKKVQLVFDKANDRHPIYTILKFYATHVMQGICGTAGVHMYYGTAQNLQSLVLDFSGDERQDAANSAIEKYKPLGWKFQDMDREATRARDMSDLDTKVIDFESLYATALSEVDKGQVLPDDISSFFVRKRKELRSVTWNERYGCIPDDEIKSSYSKGRNWERDSKIQTGSEMEADEGARFVRWVHEKLSGHKHVVPRTKWESQDIFDAKLDVFFAGFHSVR